MTTLPGMTAANVMMKSWLRRKLGGVELSYPSVFQRVEKVLREGHLESGGFLRRTGQKR
ncbi:MAG: hypothetical protein QME28_08520 [Candidatus Saccharicenans sp.]|nr:hypothetical protein [Candidatus Saccharicenans sp.]